MHVFLFEEALVLTRQTTRSNKVSYQVYRHPLPLRSLAVDVNEGEKLSGSFRGGILSSDKGTAAFAPFALSRQFRAKLTYQRRSIASVGAHFEAGVTPCSPTIDY